MKRKRILIICEYFYPINKIAAIRATKFAKYLAIHNFDIEVVCRSYGDYLITNRPAGNWIRQISIRYINEYKIARRIGAIRKEWAISRNMNNQGKTLQKSNIPYPQKQTIIKSLIIEVLSYLRLLANSVQNIGYIANVKKVLRNSNGVDVVISSYGPKSSSILGRWYKKKNPNTYWIADFRDPVYREFYTPFIVSGFAKSFVKRVCKKADLITGVSQGCLDNLYFPNHPNQVVVTNGFDRDDIREIDYTKPKKFTLSYLGSLYSGKRDISPLFIALHELILDSRLDVDDLRVCYSGPSKIDLLLQAERYDLTHIIDATDSIQHEESLKRQLESNILILATWNNIGEEGVVTGKFLEYMMMDKPIVAIVSGNLPNSKVKEMMSEGNLGFCYEEPTSTTDQLSLKEYILRQYENYKTTGDVEHNPCQEYIEQFDYKNITKQLISLFPEKLRIELVNEKIVSQ
jgi:glycosyltransferase involved in cell wall biosynthesis